MPGRPSEAKKARPVMAVYSGIADGKPAEAVDLAVVGAVVDHADDKEQHGRDDAVGEHVEHGA